MTKCQSCGYEMPSASKCCGQCGAAFEFVPALTIPPALAPRKSAQEGAAVRSRSPLDAAAPSDRVVKAKALPLMPATYAIDPGRGLHVPRAGDPGWTPSPGPAIPSKSFQRIAYLSPKQRCPRVLITGQLRLNRLSWARSRHARDLPRASSSLVRECQESFFRLAINAPDGHRGHHQPLRQAPLPESTMNETAKTEQAPVAEIAADEVVLKDDVGSPS